MATTKQSVSWPLPSSLCLNIYDSWNGTIFNFAYQGFCDKTPVGAKVNEVREQTEWCSLEKTCVVCHRERVECREQVERCGAEGSSKRGSLDYSTYWQQWWTLSRGLVYEFCLSCIVSRRSESVHVLALSVWASGVSQNSWEKRVQSLYVFANITVSLFCVFF